MDQLTEYARFLAAAPRCPSVAHGMISAAVQLVCSAGPHEGLALDCPGRSGKEDEKPLEEMFRGAMLPLNAVTCFFVVYSISHTAER